ncbi:hypothetical protein PP47_gp26 [Pectobacterium phage PP47]|uniref:Uncharacterized protein n=2 Tax=Pektosvirus TaxID=2732689 RepID=A0A1L7DS21_9CAUD|nr:hypothetical protein HOR48_gp25 [Pectobacterium phage PP81]YP_009788723.1 hypothetical protein HOR52_gp26 [Pectobacterium phage PP47]APU03044.1 hypothetical protein PP81_gp25 [Pectobacterium phage PP81]APW79762.1 hypothetical protein PP47_gp26 [Pectobacterium phage PP47]
MFKSIKFIGKLVVKAYFKQAAKLNKQAKRNKQKADHLANEAFFLKLDATDDIKEAALIAAQATELQKIFK